MTYSKAIDNNAIFSICASRVILVISLGHDGVQFVTNLFILPFLPQRWDKRLDLNKKSVHGSSKCAGCGFDKASFAARSASSFPVISRWFGIQQNVDVSKTHLNRKRRICVNELVVQPCWAPSNYMNHGRLIFNWALIIKLPWNLNQNSNIQEHAFENDIC